MTVYVKVDKQGDKYSAQIVQCNGNGEVSSVSSDAINGLINSSNANGTSKDSSMDLDSVPLSPITAADTDTGTESVEKETQQDGESVSTEKTSQLSENATAEKPVAVKEGEGETNTAVKPPPPPKVVNSPAATTEPVAEIPTAEEKNTSVKQIAETYKQSLATGQKDHNEALKEALNLIKKEGGKKSRRYNKSNKRRKRKTTKRKQRR